VKELEEAEIEENKPLREYVQHARASLTKIKEDVDKLGEIEMEDGLLLSSLTTIGEDDGNS